jgi:hypothetical protein
MALSDVLATNLPLLTHRLQLSVGLRGDLTLAPPIMDVMSVRSAAPLPERTDSTGGRFTSLCRTEGPGVSDSQALARR